MNVIKKFGEDSWFISFTQENSKVNFFREVWLFGFWLTVVQNIMFSTNFRIVYYTKLSPAGEASVVTINLVMTCQVNFP